MKSVFVYQQVYALVLLMLFSASTRAQVTAPDSMMQQVLHALERSNPGVDLQEHVNYLYQVRENPVDVNSASLGTLLTIPFIDFGTALALHEYRKENGPNITEAILLDSTRFNKAIVELLLPFIVFRSTENEREDKPVRKNNRITLFSRNGFAESQNNTRYPGTPFYSASSFRFTDTAGFFASLCFEKDIGEVAWDDYVSFSLKSRILNEQTFIILGDFAVEHGSGLLQSSKHRQLRYRFQQVAATESPKFIHPHTGFNSNSALRGIGLISELEEVTLSAYYAFTLFDAARYYSDPDLYRPVSSGLHKTETQVAGRDILRESVFGVSAAKEFQNIYLSALLTMQKVNRRMFLLHQQQSLNFSLSMLANWYRFNIKSEVAWANKAVAASAALSYSEVSGRSYLVSVVSRSKNYYAMHSLSELTLPGSGEFIIRTSYHKKAGKKTFGIYGENYRYEFSPYFSERLLGTTGGIFQSTDFHSNTNVLVSCEYGTDSYTVNNFSNENTKFRLFSDARVQLSKNLRTQIRLGYSGGQDNGAEFGFAGLHLYTELHHQLFENFSWSTKVFINSALPLNGNPFYDNEYNSTSEVQSIAITEAFRWVVQARYHPLPTLQIVAKYLKRASQNGIFDWYSTEGKEYLLSVSWAI